MCSSLKSNLVNYNASSHFGPYFFLKLSPFLSLPDFFVIYAELTFFPFLVFMVYPRSLAPQNMKLVAVFSRQLGALLSSRTSGSPETQDMHPRNQEPLSPEPSISILDFVCRAVVVLPTEQVEEDSSRCRGAFQASRNLPRKPTWRGQRPWSCVPLSLESLSNQVINGH